jgi:K+-sensing histidine kinase KdpD
MPADRANAHSPYAGHFAGGPTRGLNPMRRVTGLPVREYLEVLLVVGAITVIGWFTPFSYRAFGHVYLLAVILLCLRVGRWPVLFAAVVSALAWNFVIMPPRLSFSVLGIEDGLILGTYFVVALIAGQLTARIRAQELLKRQGEQRATALFHLTRALAAARSLDEAADAALRQVDLLFHAQSALFLVHETGPMTVHPASSCRIGAGERALAEWTRRHGRDAGRFTSEFTEADALYVPMVRAGTVVGVLLVAVRSRTMLTPDQRDLIEGFAAQIVLLIERERLRAAGEREKILAESDRLHRTLLDCVSHELKTPLAVLRSATEKLDQENSARRAALIAEVRTATRRLDRLVANLLHQTRLESGAIRPQLAACDARDLIGAARRAVGDALVGRDVRIEIPPDLPLVAADAPLMESVLANLLLNAVLYTPLATSIEVSARAEAVGDRIKIVVADHGPGIPAELREHLFQKFQRGKDAIAGGVGLGLAIVRGFVLAHGGEVVAEDNPGGGARFTITLSAATHSLVPNE